MFDRSWTVLLTPAQQLEVIDVSLPDGAEAYIMEAMLGGNSQAGNVLILEGQLSLAAALARLVPGQVDALMVVPPGGVGHCRTSGPRVMTVVSDVAVPADQNMLVTIRLRQVR